MRAMLRRNQSKLNDKRIERTRLAARALRKQGLERKEASTADCLANGACAHGRTALTSSTPNYCLQNGTARSSRKGDGSLRAISLVNDIG